MTLDVTFGDAQTAPDMVEWQRIIDLDGIVLIQMSRATFMVTV